MPHPAPPNPKGPPPREYAPLPAFLSYLVPGLGQIYQGRVAKGVLFLVCLYGLFFYGMALGNWSNVYVYFGEKDRPKSPGLRLVERIHYFGQFWIGVAAWPSIWQYLFYDELQDSGPLFGTFERLPKEEDVNRYQQEGDKTWDLGWVYTVIAGVLNILVIYDAFAGPAFAGREEKPRPQPQEAAT